MILSCKDVELLQFKENDVVVKKVKLSTGEYYAKYCTVNDAFRELLGNKIFDLVGIKCPKYTYVSEAHCVISEDIRSFDTFYNPFDLGMNGYTLKNVKNKIGGQFIQGKFTNYKEICFQIDVMHFIDILFSNIDRHISNYGFSLKEDGTGYLVVYDNADFLKEFEKGTRPMSIDTSDGLSFVYTSKRDEAREFISKISEEEKQYFMKVYEMFSPIRVLTMINSISKENGIKLPNLLTTMNEYTRNYFMVGKLLKENNKTKKK